MIILPAIDIYGGKAVRLLKGDYDNMTIYNDDPCCVAEDFRSCGAEWIHIVDLEGARTGESTNYDVIEKIVKKTGLKVEVGGGIRDIGTADKYFGCGVERVILGTAAVKDRTFLEKSLEKFGSKAAVSVDLKDDYVAIKGWTENSSFRRDEFCRLLESLGTSTVICTDISRDGAMKGCNAELYSELSRTYSFNIIASGGVSSMEDVAALRKEDIYGAIIGKAYYTGKIRIDEAIGISK